WWEKPALEALAWMPRRNIDPAHYRRLWPGFREAGGPRLAAPALGLGGGGGAGLEGLLAALARRPHTIAHSDCRGGNLLLCGGGGWAGCGAGAGGGCWTGSWPPAAGGRWTWRGGCAGAWPPPSGRAARGRPWAPGTRRWRRGG